MNLLLCTKNIKYHACLNVWKKGQLKNFGLQIKGKLNKVLIGFYLLKMNRKI